MKRNAKPRRRRSTSMAVEAAKVLPPKDANNVMWRVQAPGVEIDPELQRKDEVFWRDQEGRMTKQIAQPCCTLSGMTHLLIELPGDFAVVLHSELDCTNCFLSTRGTSGVNFYSVAVTQAQFSTGQMGPPLRRCLELIVKHRKPEAIFVLGNCLVEMVYDTFDMVALDMSEKLKTPIIPLRTSGLKHGSQAAMVDWLYSTIAGLAKKKLGANGAGRAGRASHSPEETRHSGASAPPGFAKRVNVIGMPHLDARGTGREFAEIMRAAGLEVNGTYPYETGFADWLNIHKAGANIVVDKTLYPKLLAVLAEMGLPSAEVPLPVGLEATTRFFDAIGRQCGASEEMRKACAAPAARVRARLADFRSRFNGLRVAVGLRMVNNYRVDQLAYDGLGDIATFMEMGFRIHLFIQGPGDAKSRAHFAERLKQLGCDLPFEVFPDPFDLPPLLRQVRPDVAYLADHARWETTQLGIPLVQSRSLEPLFEGALRNLDTLETVFGEIARGRKGVAG